MNFIYKNYILKNFYLILIILSIFSVCSQKAPISIEAGKEECAYCKMTIMDLKFNAQLQTKKGRVYNFDSIECLIHWIHKNPDIEIKNAWVKDYLSGEWIEYKNAIYFISPDLPSPMGANLSAYKNQDTLQIIQKEKQGSVYNYPELKEYLKKMNHEEHSH